MCSTHIYNCFKTIPIIFFSSYPGSFVPIKKMATKQDPREMDT
jgi:hypothetical protein